MAGYYGAKVGDKVTVSIGGDQEAEVTKVYRDGGVQVKLPKGIPGNGAFPPGSTTHPEPEEITHVNGKPVGGEAKHPQTGNPIKEGDTVTADKAGIGVVSGKGTASGKVTIQDKRHGPVTVEAADVGFRSPNR